MNGMYGFLHFDKLSALEKRAVILLGLKWSDKSDRKKVFTKMLALRKQLSPKRKDFNGTSTIRRWRRAR